MSTKKYSDKDVFTSTVERLNYILNEFDQVYISFSGGKDSSVLLQMLLEIAQERDELPVKVLFIDLEAQYNATISHVEEMVLSDKIEACWICLPFSLRNAVSVYQPQWLCWDPDEEDKWVREIPKYDCVISDINYFPFFRIGMEFEEFIVEYAKWFAKGKKTACLVAIRTDESLNRFRTIKSTVKQRYNDLGYSTKITENVYNFYPIYDWKTEDIWTAVGKYNYKYNKIYDFMYMQGKSIHECRICQPYGDDQRKGLNLFRTCEPETWFKIVNRVSGANFGNLYANSILLGHRKITKPDGHTWKSYVDFLLGTLPKFEAEWYKRKFKVFFNWWAEHGYPIEKVPDEADHKLEARKKVPSWRRIAKCILKNDKLCKSLTFAGTKYQYVKYLQLREEYGE